MEESQLDSVNYHQISKFTTDQLKAELHLAGWTTTGRKHSLVERVQRLRKVKRELQSGAFLDHRPLDGGLGGRSAGGLGGGELQNGELEDHRPLDGGLGGGSAGGLGGGPGGGSAGGSSSACSPEQVRGMPRGTIQRRNSSGNIELHDGRFWTLIE